MASSISVPYPKCSLIAVRNSQLNRIPNQQQPLSISTRSAFSGSARVVKLELNQFVADHLQGPNKNHLPVLKAQIHEASADGSSNSSPLSSSNGKGPKTEGASQQSLADMDFSAFMAEVSDLVKLVDSRDIMELKLKNMDCELTIRKKEAFAQPPPAAPVTMMQPPQQPMLAPQPPTAHPTPAAAPSTPLASLPSPSKGTKSSHPPLKCPMAGTFYRSPAPGEPPFVKVGDKIQKGQVVCIIEAMKLMNEIEADQSGTVVEIVAEDGKPVSVDTPLLVIQP